MEELVSVCLLTYNHAKYLGDTLRGLVEQTYHNIELLILDDCSVDTTYEIITEKLDILGQRFVRVECMQNAQNTGNISLNCNMLIKKGKGKWVRTLGGDDILLPNCISDLVQASIEHPDAAVIHADVFIEKEDFTYGNAFSGHRLQERVSGYEDKKLKENLLYADCICAPTTLFLKETFEKYGYYDEQIAWEDYEYWLRLAFSGANFYYLDKPVVVWRQGDTSISNRDTKDGENKLIRWIRMETAAKEKYIKQLTLEEQKKYWEYTYRYFARECQRISSDEGLLVLNSIYQQFIDVSAIKISPFVENLDWLLNKAKNEAEILSSWIDAYSRMQTIFNEWIMQNKKVAIFGYGRIGRRLHKELCNANVKVEFVIDYPGYNKFSTIPLFTLDEDIPKVDVIINTAIDAYEEISARLCRKCDEVIDFKTMVFKGLL